MDVRGNAMKGTSGSDHVELRDHLMSKLLLEGVLMPTNRQG